jgi:hypothetical protein
MSRSVRLAVAVVALRQPRPRSSGRNDSHRPLGLREAFAPLHAALLLAARGVPPRWWRLSRCDNPAACSGGTPRTYRSVCGKPLRRCTQRYSSQRDEFYHAKQIRRPCHYVCGRARISPRPVSEASPLKEVPAPGSPLENCVSWCNSLTPRLHLPESHTT